MSETNPPSDLDRLVAAGMGPTAAAAKERLFASARAALGAEATAAWFVPGRIEFLGKHTDYAGGRSLLCAAEQGFCVVARPRDDRTVRVAAADLGQHIEFALAADLSPRGGHWSNYPMTVARRVAANFPGDLRGIDLAFASDLPPASGMSSSSALVVATFLALSDLNGLSARSEYRDAIRSIEDLSGYLGAVENGGSFGSMAGAAGVGTSGGSQDQTAILCSLPGQLVRYAFAPVRREGDAPLPAGHAFVIASSGVVAEKTGAAMEKYNRVSRAAAVLLALWNRATGAAAPTLAAAVRSAPDAADRMRSVAAAARVDGFDPQTLLDRLDQFIDESERIIPATAAALAAGRLDEVGRLVDRSQANAERWLGNQVPETAFLAAEGRRRRAIAASAFGAGFGGSVWALVPAGAADAFAGGWAAAYAGAFPDAAVRARFFPTAAGPAALRLD